MSALRRRRSGVEPRKDRGHCATSGAFGKFIVRGKENSQALTVFTDLEATAEIIARRILGITEPYEGPLKILRDEEWEN